MTATRNPALQARPVRVLAISLFLIGLTGSLALPGRAGEKAGAPKWELPAVLNKTVPEGVEDLKALEAHVKKVIERVMPATVNLKVGPGQGSGVIVSEDGIILTAGHVSGKAGQKCTITFRDGKSITGETLGANRTIDSGMVKITTPGKYPFVPMGDSGKLNKGQYVLATGHPGGYKTGRAPVVRLGRVLDFSSSLVRTDCTLVGGDSGGPLFDMEGRVVGIHSRISGAITANIHVPVDTYRDTWERLVAAETWGAGIGGPADKGPPAQPYLGIQTDPDDKDCRIVGVVEGSPAEKAGLKLNDVITKFGDSQIASFDDLVRTMKNRRIGEVIALEVRRGSDTLAVKVTLVKRSN